MGDHADDAIERELNEWDYWSEHRDELDGWEDEDFIATGRRFGGRRHNKICRYCSTGGLHWEETKDGWRLFDGDGMHDCPAW